MARRHRQGVTLIELLVVLGLLIILATIGVSSFAGTQKVSRLVGTEQLVAGMLRQARMTARATGQAVLLYVDPTERTISGVSRLPVWQSGCETDIVRTTGPFIEGTDLPTGSTVGTDRFQTPFGHAGCGLGYLSGQTTLAAVTLFDSANPTTGSSSRNHQLTRRPGAQPTEGFQLGTVVKVPPIQSNGGAAAPACIPLLVISADGATTPPATDTAYAGLLLRQRSAAMYDPATETPPTATVGMTLDTNPQRTVWEVVGWVLKEGASEPEIISSLDNTTVPATGALDPWHSAFQLDPTSGGRWMEVSLVFTGSSLELQRDGRLIARKDLAAAVTGTAGYRLEGYGKDHRLFIGCADIGPHLAGGGLAAGAVTVGPETIFDDLHLVRLGVDQPQRFPNGVEPKNPYRLLVHPDGRLTALATATTAGVAATSTTDLSWVFTGVQEEASDQTVLTINPTSGMVSATVVNISQSAP